MAENNSDSSDDEDAALFKCHPILKVKMKICIICENVYHSSDCKHLKNIKHISKLLIVCPEHQDIDLNNKVDEKTLNLEAKTIIAQIQCLEKEKAQEEILQDISTNLVNYVEGKHNNTIVGSLNEDNDTVLQGEILLLKKLNVEMQDKNVILKENISLVKDKITQLEKINLASPITYASAIKTDYIQVKHVPTLIVKAKTVKHKNKNHKKVVQQIQIISYCPCRQDKRD